MPAHLLDTDPSHVLPFDVLAKGSGPLLTHAMLFAEEKAKVDVTLATQLQVVHMGPPLETSINTATVVGTAELRPGEVIKIKGFVEENAREIKAERERIKRLKQAYHPFAQYVIHPHQIAPSADYSLWRYSCAGYVATAYENAGLKLLLKQFPMKSVADLKNLYPTHAHVLDDQAKREALGLKGGNEWPVMLVGYLIHSLARPAQVIRDSAYQPKLNDEFFPNNDESTQSANQNPKTPK